MTDSFVLTPLLQPGLFGNNNNEFTALEHFPADPYTTGVNQTQVDMDNLDKLLCPATEEAYARQRGHDFSVPLYHYRYHGEFPNLNPFAWLGSYHAAELPLVFGTYALVEPGDGAFAQQRATADEAAVSEYMQGAWVAFAKDPAGGLAAYDGWPTWRPGNDTDGLVELGVDNKTGAVFSPSDSYVGLCASMGYNVGP